MRIEAKRDEKQFRNALPLCSYVPSTQKRRRTIEPRYCQWWLCRNEKVVGARNLDPDERLPGQLTYDVVIASCVVLIHVLTRFVK